LGVRADFVALPLTQLNDVQLYPYTLGVGDPAILIAPAEVVSVVGFPFGITAGVAWQFGQQALLQPTMTSTTQPCLSF